MADEKIDLFVQVTITRADNGGIEVRFQSGGEGNIAGFNSELFGRELTQFMVEAGSIWLKDNGAIQSPGPTHPAQPTVQ